MDATLDFIEAKGISKVNQLVSFLLQDGRMEELERSTRDEEYQKKLFAEYGLEDTLRT